MSNKIVELMTYVALAGDPKLASLLADAMGEIELSDRPAQLAKASRIIATAGVVLSGMAMMNSITRDFAAEGKAVLNELT